jgi:hypothetical protein
MKYYLLDLERTIGNGRPTYWNLNRHGYTTDLEAAGLFSRETAQAVVNSDIDKWTVMVSQQQVEKIFE